jgi:predicted CXXCH cytochrome family protein
MRVVGLVSAVLAVVVSAVAATGAWAAPTVAAAPAPSAAGPATVPVQLLAPATKVSNVAAPTVDVPQEGCVTEQCHGNIKDYKVVHGPVNVNACDACHKLTDAGKHTFVLAREKKDTCTFCHKMDLGNMPVVHKPLQTGDCLPCHNPHGGKTGKFLRGETTQDLCKQCHDDKTAGKKFVHGPAAAGACEACHKPHTAQYPKLLVAQGRELCFTCHREMGEQLKQVKFAHKPVMNGECSQCHDPHASNHVMQTREEPLKLCTTSCHEHEKIRQAAEGATYKHEPVTTGKACLNCHTPHGGGMARLMKSEPIKVCVKCHDKEIKVDKDRVVPAISEVMDPKQIKHGPIQQGNCAGCHNVHGGEDPRLLVKAYPEAFYQAFDVEKYGLCFSCHDKQLVLTERTKGLTGFRDGERNLHFVHVNKADRGRSCRACHEVHASRQPLHLREKTPYGSWQMPINYKKSGTGGSCAPGCHKAFKYDRERTDVPAGAVAAEGKTEK